MVNFFTSVREAGRGKEEVVLPSHVCSKNGKELGHQPGKSAPLYLFPGMKLPVGTPWGITPRGRWQLPNSSTFQETYETNSHTGQLHRDNHAGVFGWHKEYHLIRKAGVKGLFAYLWS